MPKTGLSAGLTGIAVRCRGTRSRRRPAAGCRAPGAVAGGPRDQGGAAARDRRSRPAAGRSRSAVSPVEIGARDQPRSKPRAKIGNAICGACCALPRPGHRAGLERGEAEHAVSVGAAPAEARKTLGRRRIGLPYLDAGIRSPAAPAPSVTRPISVDPLARRAEARQVGPVLVLEQVPVRSDRLARGRRPASSVLHRRRARARAARRRSGSRAPIPARPMSNVELATSRWRAAASGDGIGTPGRAPAAGRPGNTSG